MTTMNLARRASRGFTLVEVMVALIITSLLISILVSALYYMFRVQQSIQDETVTREADLRARAWFANAVANCLAIEEGTGVVFSGTSTELKCETTAALSPGSAFAPTTVVFSLEKLADESGVTSLAYRELSQASDKSIVIARLAGDEAQFRYQDVAGKETENWSASATDLERLPASVSLLVRETSELKPILKVALDNSPWLEQKPKNPFGVESSR